MPYSGQRQGLTTAERKDKYEVQAVEFAQVREFKKVGKSKTTKDQAIRFICQSDAADDANHECTTPAGSVSNLLLKMAS